MANKSKIQIQREANELLVAKRRLEGAQLRALGWRVPQIVEKLGISREQFRRDQVALLAETKTESVETVDELRGRENDRLDIATSAIAAKVLKGDFEAIKVWVKIIERRSRMNGLDRPVIIDGTGDGGGVVIIPTKVMSLTDWADEARKVAESDAAALAKQVQEATE